jgi:hypothetical protein
MSDQQQEKYKVCEWWLYRGFALLPVQPNTKYLVQGYGEHRKKICTSADAHEMLEKYPLANLAVLGDKYKIILDFDSVELYESWKESHPTAAHTYTERTPRGGAHVFAYGPQPYGMIFVPGVELKKICLVYPSVIGAAQYTRGAGEIIEADMETFFSSLSKVGTRSAYVLEVERKRRERLPYASSSVIEQIKANNDIHHVYSVYTGWKPYTGSKVYWNAQTVKCPFHDDHHASMFLDNQLGIYKCHACGAHGDVINLYAHFEKIPLREAIDRMARALRAVR